jgi:hypothetical protein
MSFRIFAAGSTATGGPFNVSRSGLDIDDVYEAVSAFASIAAVPITARAARDGVGAAARAVVGDAVMDEVTPTSAHEHALTALGRMTGADVFATNLTLLVATRMPLLLFIAVRGSGGLLTGAPSGTVRMRFTGADTTPSADLFRRLNPVLENCDLNSFGVLAALGRVFGEYGAVGGRGSDGEHRLNIDVTAT